MSITHYVKFIGSRFSLPAPIENYPSRFECTPLHIHLKHLLVPDRNRARYAPMPFPAAHKICHQYAFISIHIITQTPYLMLRNNQFHQYQQIPLQLTKMLSTWCLSPFLLLLFLLYFSQNVSFEELAAEYEKVIADRAFLSQGVNAILHSLDETAESIGLGPKNGHLLYQISKQKKLLT